MSADTTFTVCVARTHSLLADHNQTGEWWEHVVKKEVDELSMRAWKIIMDESKTGLLYKFVFCQFATKNGC